MSRKFSVPLTTWRGEPIMNHVKTELGQLIRDARLRQGLTLREVAERTGLRLRSVHAVEVGDSQKPKERTLRLLADALGLAYTGLVLAAYGANGQAGGPSAPPGRTPEVEKVATG